MNFYRLFLTLLLGCIFMFTEVNGQTTVIFDDMDHGNPFGNDWFAFGGSVGGGGIGPNASDLPPVNGGLFSLEQVGVPVECLVF